MNTENNKIIAEFMGWEIYNELWVNAKKVFVQYTDQSLKFHSDWNWLMKVVGKIETLKTPYDGFSWSIEPFSVLINRNNVYIQVDAGKSKDIRFSDIHCTTKIESVYTVCVEFIKWYNLNRESNN